MRRFVKAVKILFVVFLFLAVGPFLLPLHRPKPISHPFNNSRFLTIDSVKYHFRLFEPKGGKELNTIVLLHGFSGSTFSWRNITDTLLRSGYKVILVDVPPFGFSDAGRIDYSPSSQALRLWKLLDSLQVGEAILAGHSLGATWAGAMAALRPGRAEALVLVDGPFLGWKEGFERSGTMMDNMVFRRWAEVLGQYILFDIDRFKALLSSAYGREAVASEAAGYLAPFLLKEDLPGSILSMYASEENRSISADSVHCPVVIIWGEKDEWIPIQSASVTKDKLKSARLVVLKGAGHCPMETHSNEFSPVLLDFLRTVN